MAQNVFSSHLPFSLHWNLSEGTLVIARRNRRGSVLPLYPLILFLLHGLIFTLTFSSLDLPIADDANYFGSGRIFATEGGGLNADWTPVLTYFNAAVYRFLPIPAEGRFILYSFLSRLIYLWGIYAFVSRFTGNRIWAFLSTLFAAACFSYWLQMNGRAFANGAFLLLLAWLGMRRTLDLPSALAFTAISFLFRPEHILAAVGLSLYAAGRRWAEESWKGCFRLSRSTVVLLLAAYLLWLPILFYGKSSTGRIVFAFSQSFVEFVKEEKPLDGDVANGVAYWREVVDRYFPPTQRDTSSLLGRTIPLYSIASADPALFARFVLSNLWPIVTFRFPITRSPVFAGILNFYIGLSFLVWFYLRRKSETREDRIAIQIISGLLALTVLPCLLTHPLRDYLFTAVAWFFLVMPYYSWRTLRYPLAIPALGLAITLAVQWPFWKDSLLDSTSMKNRNRAAILQTLPPPGESEGVVVAEAYPVFSAAFSDRVRRSVHYELVWDDAGFLRAYHDKGDRIDFILLESTPPRHLLRISERLRHWMKQWGTEWFCENGFQLWRVQRRTLASPGQIHIETNPDLYADESIHSSKIPNSTRTIVLHWNYGPHEFRDFHIYVSEDTQDYVYLGNAASGEAMRFIWRENAPRLAPQYRSGPQDGHAYYFRVYGIPFTEAPGLPKFLQTSEPVDFHRQRNPS